VIHWLVPSAAAVRPSSVAANFSTTTVEPVTWHFNPFFGGASVATSNLLRPVTSTAATNAPLVNLAYGDIINDADLYPPGFSGSTTHMGSGAGQFQNGVMGYLGFKVDFGGSDHYGFARVTFRNDGASGTIHDWTWNSTAGASITAVPEPSQVVSLAFGLGLVVFAGWRRQAGARRPEEEETGSESRP
jgi:hypothetical protein